MENLMNGMFGTIKPGKCRLAMDGGIAIHTSNGYKKYDVKKNRLTNCDNFVFPGGEEYFFVIPTNKVEKGDIIFAAGKPKCVIEPKKDMITVINYEDATVENILPERHIFMGNTYFYGKIVSMFGDTFSGNKNNTKNIMKYMMLTEMMKNGQGTEIGNTGLSNPLLLMMMGNGFGDMFSGIFESDEAESEEEE